MPPVVNPVSDLARIYRQRIPTQTGQPAARSDRFGFGMAARPTGQTSSNPLGAVGRFLKTAVASLDPRFILSEGGRSVEHAVGDVTELGRSVITGRDTLSQSPSARAYQAAGGGAPGVFAAAMPYVNVATALVPEARLLTPAGRVAAGADVAERVGQRQLGRAISHTTPTARSATVDAVEQLAQSMTPPAFAERSTTYSNPSVYDPTLSSPPASPLRSTEDIFDEVFNEVFADIYNPEYRPPSPPTKFAGSAQPVAEQLPRGVYAVDDSNGTVTLYQVDKQGAVKGKLVMSRAMDGYTVGSLSADPGSTTAANLLAAAKITGELNYPGIQYPLQPSTNLSQFSRPLVQKLQAAGLVDPNYTLPPVDVLNRIDRPYDLGTPIPAQEIPRLVGVPSEQLREVTQDLIRSLAQAKREGRISPDTIERTAQLRADLAARQASAQRGNSGGFGFPYDPRPESVYGLPDATAAAILGDNGPELMNSLRNSSDETVRALLDVSNTAELVLAPIEQFQTSPQNFGDYLDALVASLRERLGRSPQHAGVYGNVADDYDTWVAEEVFADEHIYTTLWNMWNQYGGPVARILIDNIPRPDGM